MDVVKALDAASGESYSDAERADAIRAAHAFLARVEPPFARVTAFACAAPALAAAFKVCEDTALFEKWRTANGGTSMSYAELSKLAGLRSDDALRSSPSPFTADFDSYTCLQE